MLGAWASSIPALKQMRKWDGEAKIERMGALRGIPTMKRLLTNIGGLCVVCASVAATPVQGVELLISGDFETPQDVGDIPGWMLEEFATGSDRTVDSAGITGGEDAQLFLRAFAGGGPLHPRQGNFDDDSLPRGDVDGADFLIWQRNVGIMGTALPEQGDANADTNIDGMDLMVVTDNFGRSDQVFVNARLSQVVPAEAGQTYSFQGTSHFEDNYSGFVTELGNDSPFGTIPSPTSTTFRMEFLDAGANVVGTPTTLDLRTEQPFPGFPVIHTPLVAQAPAGTVNVRVVAEALDMAWNGITETNGAMQSAFFNDFLLENTANPGTDLLTNGNLNQGPPDALDFWNQVEVPETRDEILRTPIQAFSNHTPDGTRGVWLSAFFGAHPTYEMTPVDGTISQTVPAVAGATYTFSGWTKFEANYSGGVETISASSPGTLAGMPSPTETEITLEFLDINSVVIDSAVIDVKEARTLLSPTDNPNDNIWYQHVLEAVAPPNTRFARLTAQMIDGVFNVDPGQSAFFDDFSLDGPAVSLVASASVPEPSSLVGLAFGALMIGLRRHRKY
jgi:hypothetical protein